MSAILVWGCQLYEHAVPLPLSHHLGRTAINVAAYLRSEKSVAQTN